MESEQDTISIDPEGWIDPGTRERWMQRFSTARDRIEGFVTNNPLAAVGAAVATGFVIARIFRR